MKIDYLLLSTALCLATTIRAAETPGEALAAYRTELTACRQQHGGGQDLPDVKFFLFGMGVRTKLLYHAGILIDARTGSELRRWKVRKEMIVPCDYRVAIETADGALVSLCEDEVAVWLQEDGRRTALEGTESSVRLPTFVGKKFPRVLRVLHQELLINVTGNGPLPNFFVYPKPWYRDAAMMALALKETGNVPLLRDWILALREPFDKNNAGQTEPDNLGQVLFLVSLVSDKNHPVVGRVLAEVPRFEVRDASGIFIKGRSDFSEHPVYQTKWLKFGLRALGLPDPYVVPKVADSYNALFWMDYCDQYVAGSDANNRGNYPYLGWACDHFHGTRKSPLSSCDYPLTWEAKASQASYEGMKVVDPVFVTQKVSPPHIWHAAEAFLLLLAE